MAKAPAAETGKNDEHGNGGCICQIEAVIAHQKGPRMIDIVESLKKNNSVVRDSVTIQAHIRQIESLPCFLLLLFFGTSTITGFVHHKRDTKIFVALFA